MDNHGKSGISSLSTVSIFKAIKSDPRWAHSWAVVAAAVDCTRDLHDASLRRYTRRIGRENRMNCSLHDEREKEKCGKVIAPALETRPNERSPERAGWKHGPLIEGNDIVRTRIPNAIARAVPGSDKPRHSPTFNEARSPLSSYDCQYVKSNRARSKQLLVRTCENWKWYNKT